MEEIASAERQLIKREEIALETMSLIEAPELSASECEHTLASIKLRFSRDFYFPNSLCKMVDKILMLCILRKMVLGKFW